MKRRVAVLLVLLAAPAAARESRGGFDRWGAFTDPSPLRCYAIAAPAQSGGASAWRPFASIATWPGQGVRNQLHIRLSRERNPQSRVTLSVGDVLIFSEAAAGPVARASLTYSIPPSTEPPGGAGPSSSASQKSARS